MRIRVASDLCDYLSLEGYVVVEASQDEADVLMPAPSDLEAATKLMLEINIWQAKHGAVEVSVNSE